MHLAPIIAEKDTAVCQDCHEFPQREAGQDCTAWEGVFWGTLSGLQEPNRSDRGVRQQARFDRGEVAFAPASYCDPGTRMDAKNCVVGLYTVFFKKVASKGLLTRGQVEGGRRLRN
jgi:hypothetical protein